MRRIPTAGYTYHGVNLHGGESLLTKYTGDTGYPYQHRHDPTTGQGDPLPPARPIPGARGIWFISKLQSISYDLPDQPLVPNLE